MGMKKFSGIIPNGFVAGQFGYFADSAKSFVDTAGAIDYPVGTPTSAFRITVHLSAPAEPGKDLQFDLYQNAAPAVGALSVVFIGGSPTVSASSIFAPVPYAGDPTFDTYAVVVTTSALVGLTASITATVTIDFL